MYDWFEEEDYLVDVPYKVLNLKNITIFDNPFYVRENLEEMSFFSNLKHSAEGRLNWGAYMQGGCKLLPQSDAKLILNEVKK